MTIDVSPTPSTGSWASCRASAAQVRKHRWTRAKAAAGRHILHVSICEWVRNADTSPRFIGHSHPEMSHRRLIF